MQLLVSGGNALLYRAKAAAVSPASGSPPAAATPLRGSIRSRLLSAFAAVLAVALAGSVIGIWALREVAQQTDALVSQAVAHERLAADAYTAISVNAASYRAFALSSEPEVGDALLADIGERRRGFDKLIARLAQELTATEDRQRLAAIAGADKAFLAAVAELANVRGFGVTANIRQVYTERFTPALDRLLASVAELQQAERGRIDATADRIDQLSRLAQIALLVFGLVSFVGGALASLRLVGKISRPIQQALQASGRVARLDLSHGITGHDRDETGRLLDSLASMQQALRLLVGQVREAASSISGASAEIAQGNDDLSRRTENMAASLQGTASAMGAMSATIRQAATAAQKADRLGGSAAQAAAEGSAVVARVLETMHELERSAARVVDIVAVIESIAFQTNILALNAAVEAARAGEQGRGFAVVASEVRGLANRASEAARDIRNLIGESSQQVVIASGLANEAGRAMVQIRNTVNGVGAIVADIAVQAHQQSEGTARLDLAMGDLDLTTQQNAALVEQSAAATERLARQAAELDAMVQQFRLN
jgi:methyl-accepting chemotaxis protein